MGQIPRQWSSERKKKIPLTGFEDILVFGGRVYNPQGIIPCEISVRNSASDLRRDGKANITSTVTGGIKLRDYTQSFTNYPKGILEFRSESNRIHPTQKPVALCEYLIKTYTNEGALVLDNCAGSGTTGVACQNTGRSFILIEREREYYDKILGRLMSAEQLLYYKLAALSIPEAFNSIK